MMDSDPLTPPQSVEIAEANFAAILQKQSFENSAYVQYILNDTTEKTWVIPRRRDPSQPHNSFCEICNKTEILSYGKSSHLFCCYCNIVIHIKCMQRYKKNFKRPRNGMWMCYYCKDSIDESKATFEHERMRAERLRQQIAAQITIARYFRKYVARKYFITIYTVIIKLQIMFRVRKRKKQFLLLRQSKLRSVKVKINTCIDLIPRDKTLVTSPTNNAKQKKDNYFYILVTVIDTTNYNNTQIWKVQSDVVFTPHSLTVPRQITFDCTVLLPGVSGFQVITLTVFQKGNSRDIFLGQTYVDLSTNYYWKRGGRFVNNLSDQEYPIRDSIGLEMKSEYRFPPRGRIDFELIPCSSMSCECGMVYGTCIEDLIRTLHQMPDFAGYSEPTGGASNPAIKKKGYGGLQASPEFFNIPLKKIWIAIVDGTLYAYPHFTDNLKLVIHMEFFTPSTEMRNNGSGILFRLNHSGVPSFCFSVVNSEDILRWKCAFICSSKFKQYSASLGSASIPAAASASPAAGANTNAALSGVGSKVAVAASNFDMNLLINDIMRIDQDKLGHGFNKNKRVPGVVVLPSITPAQPHGSHNNSNNSGGGVSNNKNSFSKHATATINYLKNFPAPVAAAPVEERSYASLLDEMFGDTGLSPALSPTYETSSSGSRSGGVSPANVPATRVRPKQAAKAASLEKRGTASGGHTDSPNRPRKSTDSVPSIAEKTSNRASGGKLLRVASTDSQDTVKSATGSDSGSERRATRSRKRRDKGALRSSVFGGSFLMAQRKAELQYIIKEEYTVDDAIINPNYVSTGEAWTSRMLLNVATKNLHSKASSAVAAKADTNTVNNKVEYG